MTTTHLKALQSVRGIAALVVLLHHSLFVFITTPTFHFFSEALLNAHAAVVMFFVLSGYVLSRSLDKTKLSASVVSKFYFRRAFRIYPALWFAIAVGILLATFIWDAYPTNNQSSWFSHRFATGMPSILVDIENILALKSTLVPPAWSIRVELMASLYIPLLCNVVRRKWSIIVFPISVAFCIFAPTRYIDAHYLVAFCSGIILFKYEEKLKNYAYIERLGPLFLFVLLFFRLSSPGWRFEVNYESAVPTVVEAISGAGVLLWIMKLNSDSNILHNKLLEALGDISYSLYLLHFLVLAIISKIDVISDMPENLSAVVLMVLTFIITVPIAYLSYTYIERPGIRVGTEILDRLLSVRS